jgi:Phosphotransferase enzyme family
MIAVPTVADRWDLGSPTPVPEDPALPHLAEALDPAAMLALFRRELSLAGDSGIEACTVDRVRYRPGARAVVQYTVRLVGPSDDERREQWITVLLYPGERPRQVWAKLQTIIPAIAAPSEALRPAAFASDSNLIVQVFPIDRRLPSLPSLLNPERVSWALPQHPTVVPGAWTSEPVRYRAGVGCAIRWCPGEDANGNDTWYVKAYRDNQGECTYGSLLALRSAEGKGGFTVPEPLAYLGEHRALIQRGVPGRSLTDVLLANDDAAPMKRVAEALATFHREARAPARRRATSDELRDVRRAAALVSWVRPALTNAVRSLVREIGDGLEDVEPTATHGDLKPDHLVVSEDGLALLDLDWFSSADPLMDVGSMAARLSAMALRHTAMARRIEAAAQAFDDAYFALVPSAWQRRFPPHYSGAILMEAAGFFRHQFPNWPELVDVAVQAASDALSG